MAWLRPGIAFFLKFRFLSRVVAILLLASVLFLNLTRTGGRAEHINYLGTWYTCTMTRYGWPFHFVTHHHSCYRNEEVLFRPWGNLALDIVIGLAIPITGLLACESVLRTLSQASSRTPRARPSRSVKWPPLAAHAKRVRVFCNTRVRKWLSDWFGYHFGLRRLTAAPVAFKDHLSAGALCMSVSVFLLVLGHIREYEMPILLIGAIPGMAHGLAIRRLDRILLGAILSFLLTIVGFFVFPPAMIRYASYPPPVMDLGGHLGTYLTTTVGGQLGSLLVIGRRDVIVLGVKALVVSVTMLLLIARLSGLLFPLELWEYITLVAVTPVLSLGVWGTVDIAYRRHTTFSLDAPQT